MSIQQAHIDIEHFFADAWALTAYSAYPIEYENVTAQKPQGSPWLRLTVAEAGNDRLQMGATPQREYSGIVIINIFCVPNSQGTNLIRALIDTVIGILKEKTVSNNEFDDCQHGVNGIIDGWLQATVKYPFTRIE